MLGWHRGRAWGGKNVEMPGASVTAATGAAAEVDGGSAGVPPAERSTVRWGDEPGAWYSIRPTPNDIWHFFDGSYLEAVRWLMALLPVLLGAAPL